MIKKIKLLINDFTDMSRAERAEVLGVMNKLHEVDD